MLKWLGGLMLGLVLLLAGGLYLTLNSAPLERDAPRALPWELPDYRKATVSWAVRDDGLIHAEVWHFHLERVRPEMVAWFYQQLPIATVELDGVTYPLYHIFHPTEHGRIAVVEAAHTGQPGMGPGAVVERQEWFGSFDSRGRARLVEFSDQGMTAVPEFAGLPIGEVRHRYASLQGGTVYRVEAVIGSSHPLLGGLINHYLQTRVFTPEMMAQWQRHQVEEVSSLQFFLPRLYAQRAPGKTHFVLD